MEKRLMTYRVALRRSEEGVAVWVPGLPGCWTQGEDEASALANVHDAIREYLAVVEELADGAEIREPPPTPRQPDQRLHDGRYRP